MVEQVIGDVEAQNKLERLLGELGTWEAVGQHLGVKRSLAWQVYKGKRQSPTVRAALGLPCPVPTKPCPCGKVHVRGACDKGRELGSSDANLLRFIIKRVRPMLAARDKARNAKRIRMRDMADDGIEWAWWP